MSDLCSPPFSWRLVYYITSACLCQEVFQKFFKLFLFALCRGLSSQLSSLRLASFVIAAVLLATSLLYHSGFRLSRGFSKFFKNFFQPLSNLPLRCRLFDSPKIISYLHTPCQYLFAIFFTFFQLFSLSTQKSRAYLYGTPLFNTIYGF